ncbi:MAG: tetratricopeptide repeat protein [Anaeromyxobacteraceae bacterium]
MPRPATRAAPPELALGAALVLLVFAAFAPALAGGFVYDDHALLGPESVVRGPLWRIWFTADAWDYWPLTWSVLWLEWRVFGDSAAGYHAINVALDAAAALLLWRVLLRARVPGAWVGAALFAVHPVAVESVAWVSELKNVLSGVLLFGSALAWLHARDGGERGRTLRAASLGLFALALLAKTSVVAFPLAVLGAEWALGAPLDQRTLRRLAPFAVLSLVAGAGTLLFQHGNAMSTATVVPRGALARLADAGYALGDYVQRAFFPWGVAVTYPEAPPREAVAYLVRAAGGVAVIGGLVSGRARALGPLRLALGWHLLLVLPVLGLVDMAYRQIAPVANHLQYLALPGATALWGWGLARLGGRAGERLAAVAAAALVLGAGTWTFQRSRAYASDLALWARAAAEAPDALFAAWMYSDQLGEAGRVREAYEVLERVARDATSPETRLRARALWLAQRRRAPEAVVAHREAEALRPSPEFGQELGLILLRAGEPALAGDVLAPVASAYPRVAPPAFWLAMARLEAGDPRAAEGGLRAALERSPGDALLEDGLAIVLLRSGRAAEARARLAAAPTREPVEVRLARLEAEGWAPRAR